jgi:hypothetical protein
MEFELMAALHNSPFILAGSEGFQTFWRETSKRIGDMSITETMALPQPKFFLAQFSR